MVEKVLIEGNEAICRGAVAAGCTFYAGYPITPQNEIPEYMSSELPKAGGIFIQPEDELAVINLLYGAGAMGVRAMTSTSSPGFGLMQETISNMCATETPGVIVDVNRLGPGQGSVQCGQTDYRPVTRGGGAGGYHCVVLAPASAQECFDFAQRAFYLSDKYRTVCIILTDFILGRMAEKVALRQLDFGPLPPKDWALRGTASRGGRREVVTSGLRAHYQLYNLTYAGYFQKMQAKWDEIAARETSFEAYRTDDAALLIVSYGSSARMAKKAVALARDEGYKVGLIRPTTLWPFPTAAIRELASRVQKVLVVEDNEGQMVEDVELAVQGRVPVRLLGIWGRHTSAPTGMMAPENILEEAKRLL